MRVRVKPAEFSRMLGVSKQCVSRWIAAGKLSINPVDGRLDVQTAVQQVLRNTDPGRLRARVLRQAVEDVQGLRLALAAAEDRAARAEAAARVAELERARAVEYGESTDHIMDELDCTLTGLGRLLREHEQALRDTPDTAAWRTMLSDLENAAGLACSPDDGGDFPEIDADLAATMAEIDAELASFDAEPHQPLARISNPEGVGG